jgi:hypothetical protein
LFYISGSIRKIAEIIAYYSTFKLDFKDSPKFDDKVVALTAKLSKKNFKHIDRDTVVYKGINNKFKLQLNNKSCFNNCSCNYESFIKESVCMHLLGYSTIHDLDLCGEAYSTKPKTKLDKKSSNLCVKPIF